MNNHALISLVHVFITGVFLIYLGWMGGRTPVWAYWVALVLGVLVFIRWVMRFSVNLIPFIHVFFVAPLLVYAGVRRNKTEDIVYKLFIIIGSAAIGYHIVSLLRQ